MKIKNPITIAIAAVSGGGKTTITSNLTQKLANSKALYFDNYDFDGPDDIVSWIERGANCNEWNIDPLLNDINNFISQEEIKYIVLDYSFSRMHKDLQHIDFTIFIDTPLDIALARRLIRDYQHSNVETILNDVRYYMNHGRRGYESALKTTKPNSDLIVDGTLSVEAITSQIYDFIHKS